MMRHCLMYHGGFERNFPKLKAGATSFDGTDGNVAPTAARFRAEVDGVRVWYMEKAGKKFAAVRVQPGKKDVVLKHEVLLDPSRHMGYGNRFSPEPTIVDDEIMATLLADIMAKNPEQKNELTKVRDERSRCQRESEEVARWPSRRSRAAVRVAGAVGLALAARVGAQVAAGANRIGRVHALRAARTRLGEVSHHL